MNLAETILNNPALVREVAQSLGVGERDARSGIEGLLPSVARGLQRNAAKPGGLESLLDAVKSGGHQRYLDSPDVLGTREARDDGNAILGHVFGSKDVSRNVASRTANERGLDGGLLKQLLPVVASLAMGALSKQSTGGGSLGGLSPATRGGSSASGADLLGSFLDADGDGSAMDDVLDLAKKFF